MMKKRLFITGAHGFIGKNLVEQLQDKYKIFAPTHLQLELLNEIDVHNYIKKNRIDVIIHCANVGGARDTLNVRNPLFINLKIFFNILRNAQLVEKIINFGSGAEYGKTRDLVNVKENELDKVVPKDDYGFYKYVCSKFIEKTENILSLRLFGVYGRYENYKIRLISNSILKNLYEIPITIKQNVFFSYLYIDDLVKIVDFFIQHKTRYKIYNVTPNQKIDLITIAKIINKLNLKKSTIAIENEGLNFEYSGSNKRLKKELKINFTSYDKGIGKLIEYYRRNLAGFNRREIVRDKYIRYCLTKK
ncbi:hypothetical protein A3A46_01625 [Candidatus Roizmanbacteria bacterium RIFCSPLOWO2_01_FULL_37_13]|uniref:NAD-dependent epimerase/dehydratase domain-containing protein n=1 Tax=Candidatus Roizmanbacteria bacterium RIFCSPHIGHO2_02_FULL_38_11 TaxID=1802039 RepID=A0A1F7GZB7_9BACT|nr:MAG: hypothetical protein A3C25_05925 [Candidatus Roizmanbacteria bacterium RIFCSPHIGHO2_02_FULL_38_11]OGK32831.1 MAG: hypothetical protein A3F58_00115 [Candidatus Roizmanbacteria bacterium RIFCSPHIGHO2_12_FULL_37_9b]OGK42565.1 MAG: hypothetical protein A3A46_01625 [Candidatus Roizmanbacteria bacterium RIFCSPLOWO2_01_FULL_37_13]